jgi:hypothetical protein
MRPASKIIASAALSRRGNDRLPGNSPFIRAADPLAWTVRIGHSSPGAPALVHVFQRRSSSEPRPSVLRVFGGQHCRNGTLVAPVGVPFRFTSRTARKGGKGARPAARFNIDQSVGPSRHSTSVANRSWQVSLSHECPSRSAQGGARPA